MRGRGASVFPSMTDLPHAWFHRARAGDRDAISALWREHRAWLAATLHAHMHRNSDVEDLLQEVAAIVVKQIVTLRDPEKLRPWLRTVAINVARSAARRELARRGIVRPIADDDTEWIADTRAEAGRIAGAELNDILTKLNSLAPEYKEPLLLQCVRGLSQKEIAGVLEISEAAVETRLARARRMLRDLAPGRQSLQNNA